MRATGVALTDAEIEWSVKRHGRDEVERRLAAARAGLCPIHEADDPVQAVVAGIHENSRGTNPVAYCQKHADEREDKGTFTPLDGAR